MAVSFSRDWNDIIAEESTKPDYQTCEIEIHDASAVRYAGPTYPVDPDNPQSGEDLNDLLTYAQAVNPKTNTVTARLVVSGVLWSGQARHIPVRAGIFTGGESQLNASNIRAARFQIPQNAGPTYIRKGLTVKFTAVPRNPSLVGRWATVDDDYQGSTAAARTFHASMDIDGGQG